LRSSVNGSANLPIRGTHLNPLEKLVQVKLRFAMRYSLVALITAFHFAPTAHVEAANPAKLIIGYAAQGISSKQ